MAAIPSQPVVVQASAYPTVIQYPNGRYELRRDGIYTAYTVASEVANLFFHCHFYN